ncbi:hypothetical protein GC177_00865 [bacterium]|nr:hypothetical protein [bacterium]
MAKRKHTEYRPDYIPAHEREETENRPPRGKKDKAAEKPMLDSILSAVPDMPSFIGNLVALPDRKEASRLVKEQAGLVFDTVHGEEIRRLETELADIEIQNEQSRKAIDRHHHQLTSTSPTVKSAAYFGGNGDEAEKVKMPLRDKLVGWLCILLGSIVVVMGAGNIYSTVMAAGIPVFLDHPALALMLAAMVPIGSVALKHFTQFITHDRAYYLYVYTVYAATVLFMLAWIVQFAATFGAASSGIDWNSFTTDAAEDGGHSGASFVIVQLLADIFVGTSLFLAAGNRFSLYEKTTRRPNPDYRENKSSLKELREDHAPMADKVTQLKGRLEPLRAARQVYVNNQLVAYLKRAARFDDAA